MTVTFYVLLLLIYSVLSPLQQTREILADGSQGDVIGESTPDVLFSEFVSPM